ncbi:glycosyltransferase family 2 protein [Marivita sp.]|uniref:glycosyltransferase family 2 protein n=1 Tax=Marivita sp. TaxID=2003365 RepID=UPI003B5231E6
MNTLELIGRDKSVPSSIPIVTLIHNEANIVEDFLQHYRQLGAVSFFFVDDRSTDETSDILRQQDDVTVFCPKCNSIYLNDKSLWRSEILDQYACNKWALVPDVDEHFVFMGCSELSEYIDILELEQCEAVATIMIDMYGDMAVREHVYNRADGMSLRDTFPYFDGPREYALRHVVGASAREFPSPPIAFHGGPRFRILNGNLYNGLNPFCTKLLRSELSLDSRIYREFDFIRALSIDRLAKSYFRGALNLTKLGLIKWRRGFVFNGGAHKINGRIRISESIAGFLHYPFTRGVEGISYIANRGQHVGQGKHYKALLEEDFLNGFFYNDRSKKFSSEQDLAGILRVAKR